MEIRTSLPGYAYTSRDPLREGGLASKQKGVFAEAAAEEANQAKGEAPQAERFVQPPQEGQLLDKRLAFEMHQAARRSGQAGDSAYGDKNPSYRNRQAISQYESLQYAPRLGETDNELLPRLDTFA